MPVSTVTSKGQVTIPKKVRERLQLETGDKVDFRFDEDGSLRMHPIARKVSEVFGFFASKAVRTRSAKEIKRRLRKAFKAGEL